MVCRNSGGRFRLLPVFRFNRLEGCGAAFSGRVHQSTQLRCALERSFEALCGHPPALARIDSSHSRHAGKMAETSNSRSGAVSGLTLSDSP
jgi:hypothetical protein